MVAAPCRNYKLIIKAGAGVVSRMESSRVIALLCLSCPWKTDLRCQDPWLTWSLSQEFHLKPGSQSHFSESAGTYTDDQSRPTHPSTEGSSQRRGMLSISAPKTRRHGILMPSDPICGMFQLDVSPSWEAGVQDALLRLTLNSIDFGLIFQDLLFDQLSPARL